MLETVRHHRVHDADLYCDEFKWNYRNSDGARLARSPQAGSRARARDERGSAATERIGWGGRGGNWCPAIAESSCPCSHFHERIELVGEEVMVRSARVSRNRLGHTDPVSLGPVDVAPNYT